MEHLVKSFREFRNLRGCHFYDETDCNFLPWDGVCQFVESLMESDGTDEFAEKLVETLANYNPDVEFLAVKKDGENVSLELYSVRSTL